MLTFAAAQSRDKKQLAELVFSFLSNAWGVLTTGFQGYLKVAAVCDSSSRTFALTRGVRLLVLDAFGLHLRRTFVHFEKLVLLA